MVSRERIGDMDALKGFAIFLMVVWHALQPCLAIWDTVYSFHMHLFLFISGYLFGLKPIVDGDGFLRMFRGLAHS